MALYRTAGKEVVAGIHAAVHRRLAVLLTLVLLLTPALGLRFFTSVYPFLATVYLSLTNTSPFANESSFVGLENYRLLLQDFAVRRALSFTILFVICSTAIQLLVGLLIALLLNASFRLRSIVRAISLMPWAIPPVVAAVGFRFMFDRQFGIITDVLRRVYIDVPWLIDPGAAQAAVIFVNSWRLAPFVAVIILAGLQGIPQEILEAARIDGASQLRIILQVMVPMILPLVVTVGIFLTVWQLGTFDVILGMTGGGPGTATTVLAYLVYLQAFIGLAFGYASAIAMILFTLVLIAGVVGLLIFRRVEV